MGTFMGHALPGSFFIIFATWWTVQIFIRYYRSLRKGSRSFMSTMTYPCSCLCGRLATWELEGFLKIFFTTVGFLGEIITAHEDGHFVHLGNGQHATMFFMFGLSGVIDLMVHHRFPLPRNIQYIITTLALCVEGVLFKFHLHGRADLDVLLHTLLIYTVYANIASTLLEMRFQKNVLTSLARTFFVMLQGTWFWQAGFILYPPFPGMEPWDLKSHPQMMIATMAFTWHMGGVFIFMLLIGGIVGFIFKRRGLLDGYEYDSLNMQLIKTDTNGHTVVNLNDESDSDLEYEKPLQKAES